MGFFHRTARPAVLAAAVLAALGCAAAASAGVSVYASGLNNPRGLEFGPDGHLYVAEGGLGGTAQTTTAAQCAQVVDPIGPYSGDFTASIAKIVGGAPVRVATGLPSSQTGPALGSLVSGVADVAWVGGTLYGLEAAAGCSHGFAHDDNSVFRVDPDGSTTQVADLSAFVRANPVAHPEEDDFEPDGTWYSMVAVHGDLYAVEPNHGEVDRISLPSGAIDRVVDVSASQGHIVPTTIAYKGNFFLGNLGTFPVTPGTQTIFKLTPSGQLKPWATGLTTVLGMAFDGRDRLYVLESITAAGFPAADPSGTGQIVRIDPNGRQTTIVTGLTTPSGMTMGPDGTLYVSNIGFGPPIPGLGQVLRITVSG